ncbi:MAG TPA: DMT family transporter [Micromonosporaceae bacterium]
MNLLAATAGVPVALASAASFGISSVLQYRATHEVPEQPAGRPGLFLSLARRPLWRWSIVLAIVGFMLQVLALKLAPLTVVQPLLVTGLLWYVVVSAATRHRRPDQVIILGSVLCLVSLSMFLVLARPGRGTGHNGLDNVWSVLPLAGALTGIVVGCIALAGVIGPTYRPLPLALATGVCYGVTAGFVRSLSSYFGEGLLAVLGHWQTYAIIVLGPIGVLLNQNSYQAGRLGAPALAIITVTDPLVSISVGVLWLDENLRIGGWWALGEIVALCGLVGGVFLLAHRAPHVAPAAPAPPKTAEQRDAVASE